MKHLFFAMLLLFGSSVHCLAVKELLEPEDFIKAIVRSDLKKVKELFADEEGGKFLSVTNDTRIELINLAQHVTLNRIEQITQNGNVPRRLLWHGGAFMCAGLIKSFVDIFFRTDETTKGLGGARLLVTDAVTDASILGFAGYTIYRSFTMNPEKELSQATEIATLLQGYKVKRIR